MNSIQIRTIKIFTFVDPNQSNENLHLCSPHRKLKLQHDPILLRMLVFILMQCLTNFGTESFSLNILIHHFNYSEVGKVFSYSFISAKTPYYSDCHIFQTNTYNTLQTGLHDKFFNLTPFLTFTWFFDAFISLFGYPCYILTQCGIFVSTIFFIQTTIRLLIKLY